MPAKTTLDVLLQTAAAFALDNLGEPAVQVSLTLLGGAQFLAPVPRCPCPQGERSDDKLTNGTTPLQDRILDALAGRILTTDALATAADCDRRTLFRPGGLKELVAEGLVTNKPRAGYFRPDAPPDGE